MNPTRNVDIGDTALPCFEAASGELLVLMHGALGDWRTLAPAAEALSDRARAVSYSQRYFGDARDHGARPFGTQQQAEDLIALLDALGVKHAHVAAWSFGAHSALAAAVQHPERLLSLTLYDPGFPTYVTDKAALDEIAAEGARTFGAIGEAAGRQDWPRAAELLCEASAGEAYAWHPDWAKRIHQENAGTIPLFFTQTPPVAISPDDLRGLKVKTTLGWGENSGSYRICGRAAAALIPNCTAREIAGANHLWPEIDPLGFAQLAAEAL